MSRPRKNKSRRAGWTDRDARKSLLPGDVAAVPTIERQTMKYVWTETGPDGKVRHVSLGSGLRVIDAEIAAGGIVRGQTVQDGFECLLDILHARKVLDDPADAGAGPRRYLAGLEIRRIYEDARIADAVTPNYDKMTGITMPGEGTWEKSDYADEQEALFRRMMRTLKPFDRIVNRVCKDEPIPERLHEALRRGLDLTADALWGPIDNRRRRIRGGPIG